MITDRNYLFAFFPYLQTSEPVRYRRLVIRSTDDLADIPTDAARHLEILRSMFFLRENLRIQKMSYTYHISEDNEIETSQFVQQLLEFQALVCFIYSSPHHTYGDPFLNYEHSSFYLLRPKRFSKYLVFNDHNVDLLVNEEQFEVDERGEIEGYEGQLNNKSHFWVTKKNHIFPPATHMRLNISQDLKSDFDYRSRHSLRYQPVVDYFATREVGNSLGQRVLTAITWYNRSLKMGIDEEVALVNLAIAFESLLDLEQGEKVTDRFKEAVRLLLGGFPRLDSWLTQFYDARSEIVHEGKSQNLMFVATDNPKKRPDELVYRSLVSYGRQIFQVCVVTILTGARISEQLRLSSMLVTNQQRFERICQTLSKGEGTADERILAVSQDVNEIETYRFVSEKGLTVNQLIGTTKLLVQQFLDTTPDLSPELITQMKDFISTKSDQHYEALSLLREILNSFERLPSTQPISSTDAQVTVKSLMESVWHYVFMYYFQLKRKQTEEQPE